MSVNLTVTLQGGVSESLLLASPAPPPPPPPPSGAAAKFMRITYAQNYSSVLSDAAAAARYDVIWAQSNLGPRVAQIPTRRAMYFDLMLARPGPWTTQNLSNITDTTWFLYDAAGSPLKRPNGDYVLDPANTARVSQFSVEALSTAKRYGFVPGTGIWLDDVAGDIAFWTPSVYDHNGVLVNPDRATWQARILPAVRSVVSDLHAAGYWVYGNIGGAGVPGFSPFWQQCSQILDGVFDEFVGNPNRGYSPLQQVQNIAYTQSIGKFAGVGDTTATRTNNVFSLGLMLLATQGRAAWSVSNANTVTAEAWWPEYDTAIKLGNPTGPMVTNADKTLQRPYTNGLVHVDLVSRVATW